MEEIITKRRLISDLENINIKKGDLLNIKASVRSIGKIEGGVNTLIESLIEVVGKEGTIVTDSFISMHPIIKLFFKKSLISMDNTPSYAGVLANAMVKYPGSMRSRHPVQKFSAIGYAAKDLTYNHTNTSYAYEVLKKMSENGGKNLKIGADEKVVGVGTTHVAVGILRFKQRTMKVGINFVDDDGKRKIFVRDWAGGCGRGFNNFIKLYREKGAIISEGLIGSAESKLTDMKKTLNIELEKLRENPSYFLCDDPTCVDCRLSWSFSSDSLYSFIIKNHKQLKVSRMLFAALLRTFPYYLPK